MVMDEIQNNGNGSGSWQVHDDGVVILADGTELRAWSIADISKMTPEMIMASGQVRGEVKTREQRICVCGHPVSRHMTSMNPKTGELEWTCAPTRMSCWCTEVMPVIDTSDARVFLRKTKSIREHALTRGIEAITAKGKTWEWLPGQPHCFICEEHDMPVWPLLLDKTVDAPVMVLTAAIEARRSKLEDILCCARCCAEKWPDAARTLELGE